VVEIGDLSRFASAAEFMAFVGLVPSEHSSGEAVSYVAGWGEDGKLAVEAEAATLIDELASKLEGAIAPEREPEDSEAANTSREAVSA
jgi:hypothetical protein